VARRLYSQLYRESRAAPSRRCAATGSSSPRRAGVRLCSAA